MARNDGLARNDGAILVSLLLHELRVLGVI
jgi:hypothetical protein